MSQSEEKMYDLIDKLKRTMGSRTAYYTGSLCSGEKQKNYQNY